MGAAGIGVHVLKRVICCLDGTWNTNAAESILTNVAKLHHAIPAVDSSGVKQVSHYIAGIASEDGEVAQFLKGATGYGSLDRIQEGYEKIAGSYEAGDDLYLFGFSRGAYEARSLAALIDVVGLPKNPSEFSFDDAWAVYRKPEALRDAAALAAVRATTHYPVRIKCVGVWDTVGNIGNPFISGGPISRMFEFHNRQLPASVDVGLHALSIDEIRGPFRPTLWTLPRDTEMPQNQQIEQVWFAGSHADVGGGYRETELSDITLLWMAERARATAGLRVDTEELKRITRPDPLGPQHGVASGGIFKWSGRLPYIRLIKQKLKGIPALRRSLIGVWRSGKVPHKEVPVNESVHDSVLQRYEQRVVKYENDQSHIIQYRPRNLTAAIPEIEVPIPLAEPAGTQQASAPKARRRVKIFTVHGTFDHEAGWDNWSAKDKDGEDISGTLFVRRLSEKLRNHGIDFDEVDHTQYNWSGGNSHDERRIAAVGLKKAIEQELAGKDIKREYSGGVYVIGHSHGGTVARLTMNLWAKNYDYYEPIEGKGPAAFKHDDECPVCRRERNGEVGPNTVPPPDGVITFGSPFVRFKKRSAGLLTAKLGAWVFFGLALIATAAIAIYLHSVARELIVPNVDVAAALQSEVEGAPKAEAGGFVYWLMYTWILLWPVAFYWLFASWLPQRVVAAIKSRRGDGDLLLWAKATAKAIQLAGLAGLAVYFSVCLLGGWGAIYRWFGVLMTEAGLPLLWVFASAIFFWIIAVRWPGRMLDLLEKQVMALREQLPKKYDPREDRPMAYLSYHTTGDEAGVHLRLFGFITWLVQTLSLSAASALAIGLLLLPVLIPLVVYVWYVSGPGRDGLSEESCAALFGGISHFVDLSTYYPAKVWRAVLGLFMPLDAGFAGLSGNFALASWLPLFLMLSLFAIFVIGMPIAAIGLGIAYLVGMWLRGSGMVFGSEKMTWTLANQIGVSRLANSNTKLRTHFITPEAWRKGEIAHCYYYKNEKVIQDVANHIVHWSDHTPTRPLPMETWIPVLARGLIVLLFILSIPLFAVVFLKETAAGKAAVKAPGSACEKAEQKPKATSKPKPISTVNPAVGTGNASPSPSGAPTRPRSPRSTP